VKSKDRKMTDRLQTIPVKSFLENMGLVQYLDMFLIKGYDSESDITYLDEKDLDAMLISDPDHRHQILQAGKLLSGNNSSVVDPESLGKKGERS
jgi:hypothetical protein